MVELAEIIRTKDKDGNWKTLAKSDDGKMVKEIPVSDKNIQTISQSEVLGGRIISEAEIPEEFKQIPTRRRTEDLENLKRIKQEHGIKTSDGRKLEKKVAPETGDVDWLSGFLKTISDPESLNQVSDFYHKMAEEQEGSFIGEILEKQFENADEMDNVIKEEQNRIDEIIKQNPVLSGLIRFRDQLEALSEFGNVFLKLLVVELDNIEYATYQDIVENITTVSRKMDAFVSKKLEK